MREQAALWTKEQKEDRRVECERSKVEREREKERKAAERAELQRKKQEAKEATAAQKAVQSSQSVKRAASQKAGSKAKKACIARAAEGSGGGSEPASAPPPKRTKTRSVNLPAQYLDKPKKSQSLVYHSTIDSHDNNYCGWLYSLIFVGGYMVFGGASRRSGRLIDSYVIDKRAHGLTFTCSIFFVVSVATPQRAYPNVCVIPSLVF
jgi:hypothetical protein